eukprot:gene20116-14131_t
MPFRAAVLLLSLIGAAAARRAPLQGDGDDGTGPRVDPLQGPRWLRRWLAASPAAAGGAALPRWCGAGYDVSPPDNWGWYRRITCRYPFLEAHFVVYHTSVRRGYADPVAWHNLTLPFRHDRPGRFQSIYEAAWLVRRGGYVV